MATPQFSNLTVRRKDDRVQKRFSFPERIFYTRQLGLKIATMKNQNRLLLETNKYKNYKYPAATWESFVYEAKGKPFGNWVEVPFTNPETGKVQVLVRRIRGKQDRGKNVIHIIGPGQCMANKQGKKIMTIDELNGIDVLRLMGRVIGAREIARENGENFSFAGRDDLELYTSNDALIGSFVRLADLSNYIRRGAYAFDDPSLRLWVPTSTANAKVEKAKTDGETQQKLIVPTPEMVKAVEKTQKEIAKLEKTFASAIAGLKASIENIAAKLQ
jgi:hypothetical protein